MFYLLIDYLIDFNVSTRQRLYICLDRVGLVWFHSISTIVSYLMPNPLYPYKYENMICEHIWNGR